MRASSTPKGYHSLTPWLVVEDVDAAVSFYKTAFGAQEVIRREQDGRVLLADLLIGDSHLQVSHRSNHPAIDNRRPESAFGLRVYLDDVDAAFKRALGAGATQKTPVEEKFFGDRVGEITDPFGHSWKLSQHIEDLTSDTIEQRMYAAKEQGSSRSA